jgi:hypothetical protein
MPVWLRGRIRPRGRSPVGDVACRGLGTYSGSNDCKVSVGGQTYVMDTDNNGQFGQYMRQQSRAVTSGSTQVTWTCKNSVSLNSSGPLDMDLRVNMSQFTPNKTLVGLAL